MPITYQLRGDCVLVKRVKRPTLATGIALSEKSQEAYDFFIEGVGDKVTDLNVGDQVVLRLKSGEQFYPIPRTLDMVIVDQWNVAGVVHGDDLYERRQSIKRK